MTTRELYANRLESLRNRANTMRPAGEFESWKLASGAVATAPDSIEDWVGLLDNRTTDAEGITRGSTLLTVNSALCMLAGLSVVNRRVDWQHVVNLANSYRRLAMEEQGLPLDNILGAAIPYCPGVNAVLVSSLGFAVDGRHRMCAYILAFGSETECRAMLRIVRLASTNTADQRSATDADDKIRIPNLDKLGRWTGNPATVHQGLVIGVTPSYYELADQVQRSRSAVDVLEYAESTSAFLTEYTSVSAKWLADVLTLLVRRCRTVSGKPGSLDDSGKLLPASYETAFERLRHYVESYLAVRVKAGDLPKSVSPTLEALLVIALAGEAVDADRIVSILKAYAAPMPAKVSEPWPVWSYLRAAHENPGSVGLTSRPRGSQIWAIGYESLDADAEPRPCRQWVSAIVDLPSMPDRDLRLEGPDSEGIEGLGEIRGRGRPAKPRTDADPISPAPVRRKNSKSKA